MKKFLMILVIALAAVSCVDAVEMSTYRFEIVGSGEVSVYYIDQNVNNTSIVVLENGDKHVFESNALDWFTLQVSNKSANGVVVNVYLNGDLYKTSSAKGAETVIINK